MRIVIVLLALCVTLGQAHADPVDLLVKKLSAPGGLWLNGIFPNLDLPASASTAEVLELMFQRVGFDKGRVKSHKILAERDVVITGGPSQTYRAVTVETDLGKKIVLLQYQKAIGWWSRVYDEH